MGSVDSTRPRIQHISKRLGAKSDVYDCLGYSFQATEVTAWGGHAVPEECHKPLPTRRPEKSLMLLPYSLIRPYSTIGQRSIVTSVSVCLAACCLSAIISSELHLRYSPFLCMLPMAVEPPSSGGVLMCYVLPVSWITSYVIMSRPVE